MTTRTCPACNKQFNKSRIIEGIRHCPLCNAEIFYLTGRNSGVILMSDKYCADELVQLLIDNIQLKTLRDTNINMIPELSPTEWANERLLAYRLIERSKTFLSRQPDSYNLCPYLFIREVVRRIFADDYWQRTTSFLFIINVVGRFAQDYFKEIAASKNREHKFSLTVPDYSLFAVRHAT